MKITTSSSLSRITFVAIEQAATDILRQTKHPHLLLVYFTEEHNIDLIQTELARYFPHSQLLGCSSCQGIMSDKGYGQGPHLALWALEDNAGAYGAAVHALTKGIDVFYQAKAVLNNAVARSGREGELPALILLHATPGYEEKILHAIRSEFGVAVPIIGGSAADNQLQQRWRILDSDTVTSAGIGIAVFYPSARVSYSFHSGYASIGYTATATKTRGRTLLELNGRPAIDVYASWYKKVTHKSLKQEKLFLQSALFPLGRQTGEIHGTPYYSLSHPAVVSRDGGITMFCNINEGDVVHLMSGTTEMLVSRAGRVVNSANELDENPQDPIGGLAIYCAGCMQHIKSALNLVADNISDSMQQAPFICPFTFGEQGQFLGGEIAHGNLMISAVLFHREEI